MDIGVPQGCVLGLLFFSRFVNNHPPSSEESPVLFEDNTTLSVAGHPIDGISSMLTCVLDVAHIRLWTVLNASSTKCMLISSNWPKSLSALNVHCPH